MEERGGRGKGESDWKTYREVETELTERAKGLYKDGLILWSDLGCLYSLQYACLQLSSTISDIHNSLLWAYFSMSRSRDN